MKEFVINAENEGQRFDKYLGRILKEGSMSFVYKMLRKKNFVLNDKKSDGKEILKSGDIVKLYISDETYEKFRTKPDYDINESTIYDNSDLKPSKLKKKSFVIKNNIIYEDSNILLINKPSGILSQKAKADDISLNEYIIDYLIGNGSLSNEQIINYKPSVINRLDRNTTGIIVAAKNLKTARILSKDLKERAINKYYKCLVLGEFDKAGNYSGYLTKNNDSNKVVITENPINDKSDFIETEYSLIKTLEISNMTFSLVKVHLITGKSHQIRAHISYLGYPILGDNKYGNALVNKKLNVNMQKLHAYRIEFPKYSDELDFAFSNSTFECDSDF